MRLPKNINFEDASTIGLGAITVGQGLFQKNKGLGLEFPGEGNGNGEWVLIYGGSTATGTLGIQWAKQAGYKVDPSSASKIRELTGNKLRYAWDTNGDDASAKHCADALSSEAGAHFGTILMNKAPRDDVKTTGTTMYTIFGESFFKVGMDFPASKDDFEFGKMWFNLTEKLVAEGKVVAHPAKVGNGGLEGVLQGLNDIKNGKVSGQKLVYNL
ncbi:hypothetical protein V491_00094 [Pseudogymnoascus sp. VKM F-3775]|nr:hypothetical protein V491_00094 [Pseudogymnoascus sp. VKM F-3775]